MRFYHDRGAVPMVEGLRHSDTGRGAPARTYRSRATMVDTQARRLGHSRRCFIEGLAPTSLFDGKATALLSRPPKLAVNGCGPIIP
jgi:hypothetical protein